MFVRVQRNVTTLARLALWSRPQRNLAECNEPTAVTPETIEGALRKGMRVKNVLVNDVSGNGSFFQVAVQSPDFQGLPLLKQHQKVNALLKEHLKQVHGISIKTLASEEE